eukprot:scaffold86489_cov21-Tisochrysis_lutea.AAC.1
MSSQTLGRKCEQAYRQVRIQAHGRRRIKARMRQQCAPVVTDMLQLGKACQGGHLNYIPNLHLCTLGKCHTLTDKTLTPQQPQTRSSLNRPTR